MKLKQKPKNSINKNNKITKKTKITKISIAPKKNVKKTVESDNKAKAKSNIKAAHKVESKIKKPLVKKQDLKKNSKKQTPKQAKTKIKALAKPESSQPKLLSKNSKNNKKTSENKKPKAEKIIETKEKNKKNSKNSQNNLTNISFGINSFVVYPSHGVGKIINIEENIIANQKINCYHIFFDKEKLSIKIPVKNSDKFGIRPLSSKSKMEEVLSILRSGVKKMKGMWSRRAQEYETKINSGDIIMLAEVLRDLTRDIDDSERSYSERIIYETAIFRLACEYSAIYNINFEDAKEKIIITAKDKLESDKKTSTKDDGFDDFDNVKIIKKDDEDDEEEDEEEEEEEDDFNYEYNEDDNFDDEDDDTPKKRKK